MEEIQKEETILLTELKAGSSLAFKYFYDKYRAQLYRKFLKMVRLEEIAEELLQDLFIKVWDKKGLIDPEQSFKAYLYRIAEHIVYDFYRKVARESRLEQEVAHINTELSNPTEEGIFEKEAQHKIDEALSKLPPQQKLVFTLCKMEGKSYKEVAQQLGISPATVNAHITSATKTLKIYLMDKNNLTYVMIIGAAIAEIHR